MNKAFYRLGLFACAWTLVVIMLGAYVRLSDAGLGCPDWPGCYGHITIPKTPEEISAANAKFDRPVEQDKAWKEMIHRYLASGLGLMIIMLAIMAFRLKRNGDPVKLSLAIGLVGLVIFQGLLGMWTVTLLVKPFIVTMHLLFGMATLCLLWCLYLSARAPRQSIQKHNFVPIIVTGFVLLIAQIALGGWVSTNYAAVACVAFPGCQVGNPWPANMDFAEGFVLWRGLGVDYEFGVLDSNARIAIHMTHRVGALIVALYWLWAFWRIQSLGRGRLKSVSGLFVFVLAIQIMLGISNVIFKLPISIAVAHNGVAAILLVLAISLWYHARLQDRDRMS